MYLKNHQSYRELFSAILDDFELNLDTMLDKLNGIGILPIQMKYT